LAAVFIFHFLFNIFYPQVAPKSKRRLILLKHYTLSRLACLFELSLFLGTRIQTERGIFPYRLIKNIQKHIFTYLNAKSNRKISKPFVRNWSYKAKHFSLKFLYPYYYITQNSKPNKKLFFKELKFSLWCCRCGVREFCVLTALFFCTNQQAERYHKVINLWNLVGK